MIASIPFVDLQAQRRRLGESLTSAIQDAVESGQWIMGPQVEDFEKKLAAYAGVKHCVTCANGTDALIIVLRAWGIGYGDAVFVPAFTFAASAEAVALVGASPVFVDVLEDTYNMDPVSLKTAIEMVRRQGTLRARVVMPVDLFGQPADYRQVAVIARQENLKILCDTAQGFGGVLDGRRTGGFGDAAATSFFPAKPLGCYGDGGAVLTNDSALDELLRSIRIHGQGTNKYENVRIGTNSRLDTIQAAILIEKLKVFTDEIAMRGALAERYKRELSKSDRIRVPHIMEGAKSTWAQFTIQASNRNRLQQCLKSAGVPTAIYYPIPLSQQRAYTGFPSVPTPVSEKLSNLVLSLPMYPDLDELTQDAVIDAVLAAVK